MSLSEEERLIMVSLEKEKSLKTIEEIDKLLPLQLWDTIANRLYYAAFHAVTALLIKDKHTAGTHQGMVIMLNQYYVKTGVLAREYGRFYSQLQTMREKADYNCSYNVAEQDILPLIEQTKQFVSTVLSL